MLEGTTLGVVGIGVMGEAAVRGLLRRRLLLPQSIVASHPRANRREYVGATFGVRCVAENRDAAAGADIVLLSVKPQVLPTVLRELRGAVSPDACILSMVAGARIRAIAEGTHHGSIVRCMPNTCAQVGEGMSVWTATAAVSSAQKARVAELLGALGPQLSVEKEDYLDMATAVSGTGPAYVFLLMEGLIDAAVHLGFSRSDAKQLVLQTLKGAALFAERMGSHPAELRNMVTSPGGTTAAALYQLEKGGFRTVISKAVWAAFQRSAALGELQLESSRNEGNGERSGLELAANDVIVTR